MEFLSTIFGNLTSGIIRLGVAVGILAAVYFFLVKPILHTTENTVDSVNKSFEKSFNPPPANTPPVDTKAIEAQSKAIEAKINKTVEDVNRQVQAQVNRSFHSSKVHGSPEKLLHCIQRATGNVHRIERCTRRY
jgi:uncharacterized protein YoxC